MPINYRSAIRNSVDNVVPGLMLSRGAVKIINNILLDLNRRLVEACKKGVRRDVMSIIAADKAIDTIFPGNLKRFAICAASMSIFKYKTGVLVYKAPIKKKTKPPTKMHEEFRKGIRPVVQLIDPNIRIANNSKKLIGLLLEEGCKVIIQGVHNAVQGKETVEIVDVINAVSDCFAPTMAKHAISEGSRNALLSANTLNESKLKKCNDLRKKLTKTKRKQDDQPSRPKKSKVPKTEPEKAKCKEGPEKIEPKVTEPKEPEPKVADPKETCEETEVEGVEIEEAEAEGVETDEAEAECPETEEANPEEAETTETPPD